MPFARRPRSSVSLLLISLALGGGLACSVILNPDDQVQRCGSASDCDDPGDERFEAVCVSDPDANIDTTRVEQICVAELRTIGCRPRDYEEDSLFRMTADAREGASLYQCDTPGVRGCEPDSSGACLDGLVLNGEGFCDTSADSDNPAVFRTSYGLEEPQDVLDQFCRSFFCDEEFVCDTTDERYACVRCDPDAPFGQGGCGTVFTQGSPSCVYTTGVDEADDCGTIRNPNDVEGFGNCG